MTVAELMRNNFDAIFIELNPVKREAMMREAYTEDCVWIHPGGRLVGIAAINEAASEIRKRIPEYRYTVVGDIQTMHTVGICRWGSGLLGQPFRYTGTDVVEERDGLVAIFYTFIDSGTPQSGRAVLIWQPDLTHPCRRETLLVSSNSQLMRHRQCARSSRPVRRGFTLRSLSVEMVLTSHF